MPRPTLPETTDEEREVLASITPQDVVEARVWASGVEPRGTAVKVRELTDAEDDDGGR